MDEIKIQERVASADRAGSGDISQDEFQDLVRGLTQGALPTGGEKWSDGATEFGLIMRVADLQDCTGPINLAAAHFVLRTWNRFQNLDHGFLTHFSKFDLDERGHLVLEPLRELLVALNGGVPVSSDEVQAVAEWCGPGRELPTRRVDVLCAVVAWYANVERCCTDLVQVWHEAADRVAAEHDHVDLATQGAALLGQAAAVLRGDAIGGSGYLQVRADSAAVSMDGTQLAEDSASQLPEVAMALFVFAGKFCAIGAPFAIGLLMLAGGWHSQGDGCPRNLSGILVWFGVLSLALGGLTYVHLESWSVQARLAIWVMLIVLNVVSLSWAFDGAVERHRDLCGEQLVWYSRLIWLSVPAAGASYTLHRCKTHSLQMKRFDRRLQRDMIV